MPHFDNSAPSAVHGNNTCAYRIPPGLRYCAMGLPLSDVQMRLGIAFTDGLRRQGVTAEQQILALFTDCSRLAGADTCLMGMLILYSLAVTKYVYSAAPEDLLESAGPAGTDTGAAQA